MLCMKCHSISVQAWGVETHEKQIWNNVVVVWTTLSRKLSVHSIFFLRLVFFCLPLQLSFWNLLTFRLCRLANQAKNLMANMADAHEMAEIKEWITGWVPRYSCSSIISVLSIPITIPPVKYLWHTHLHTQAKQRNNEVEYEHIFIQAHPIFILSLIINLKAATTTTTKNTKKIARNREKSVHIVCQMFDKFQTLLLLPACITPQPLTLQTIDRAVAT